MVAHTPFDTILSALFTSLSLFSHGMLAAKRHVLPIFRFRGDLHAFEPCRRAVVGVGYRAAKHHAANRRTHPIHYAAPTSPKR
jgi:hypothetical protein